jgi:protein-S-isoprenylcysteine O-methyltransferase Ste14
MITRMVAQTILWLTGMGGVLFLAAGDWRWPQGWALLAELGLCSFAVSFWLLRRDPALLASRLSGPIGRDQVAWDRLLMPAIAVVFLGWTVLMGMDAHRFLWSRVPLWLQVAGAILIALGMLVVWQTFRFNTFAAPQVRVQTARAHRVITEGPYRIVRHPMYAGGMLVLLGMPLLLGSWWGVAGVPLLLIGIAPRAVGEERLLRRELCGYGEYADRVRFRLIPGVW